MQAITTVLSGPLPIAISTTVALSCLAAVWFFALPLLEEVKNLRSANSDLQSVITTYVQRSDVSWSETLQAVQKINNRLEDSEINEQLQKLHLLLSSQTSTLESLTERLAPDVISRLQAIANGLATHIEDNSREDKDANRELERISRALDQLSRQLTDMNDRQSQVTGILTGMSMLKSSNRSL